MILIKIRWASLPGPSYQKNKKQTNKEMAIFFSEKNGDCHGNSCTIMKWKSR